jgi:outer membrane protein TolC
MTVAEAVAEALAHNPAMQEAEENLAAAREGIKSARAARLPQLSLGYGYTALKETPIIKTAGDAQVAHQRSYDWNVTVVQPLFTGFALDAQHQIAKLDTTTRELEINQVGLDIIRNTRSACYNLLLTRKLLLVSEDEVKTLTAHKAEAEHFHSQGLIPLNDQLRAEVALSNAIQNRENVRANVQKAILSINRLLNRPLSSELTISEETGLDMDMGADAKAFDLAALNALAGLEWATGDKSGL